jgi:hypothetical protein
MTAHVAERTTRSTVSFLHPFTLSAIEGEQPAGAYRIETVDERLDTVSASAYRRVSTTIELPAIHTASRSREYVTIDPAELNRALERDALA